LALERKVERIGVILESLLQPKPEGVYCFSPFREAMQFVEIAGSMVWSIKHKTLKNKCAYLLASICAPTTSISILLSPPLHIQLLEASFKPPFHYSLFQSFIMPGVWQRHPRYSLLILAVLATTLYLLVPFQQETLTSSFVTMTDNDLPNRMERANQIYNKVLEDRKGLIQKFGPTPKDIAV
jgi:hypothetical protein